MLPFITPLLRMVSLPFAMSNTVVTWRKTRHQLICDRSLIEKNWSLAISYMMNLSFIRLVFRFMVTLSWIWIWCFWQKDHTFVIHVWGVSFSSHSNVKMLLPNPRCILWLSMHALNSSPVIVAVYRYWWSSLICPGWWRCCSYRCGNNSIPYGWEMDDQDNPGH